MKKTTKLTTVLRNNMEGNKTKLAIKGGKPVAPNGLKTKWPIYDEKDKEALIEVLNSGKWWRGAYKDQKDSYVGKFERGFAEYCGAKYGVAVANGTAAIEIALKASGIEAGDEVIVPAATFIATATAVVMVNAIPIIVDILPETYQIDPDRVEAAVTEKTKAIIPVHYGGYPADMDRIMKIAKKYNLLVIEDAAEAHGSEWRGQKVGSIGDMGTFSFQMGKPLTCGEGGIVLTNSEELASKCYAYHHIGRFLGTPIYEHSLCGWNYRMTEFQGGLLLAQLTRLPEQTEIRAENGEYLAKLLDEIDGVSALKRDPRVTKRGYYFYFIRFDESEFEGLPRDRFIGALRAEGVPCSTAHNQPLYKNPVFQGMNFGRTGCPISCPFYGKEIDYSKVSCPIAERVFASEVVAMGKDFLLEKENVDLIIEAIKKIKENLKELL